MAIEVVACVLWDVNSRCLLQSIPVKDHPVDFPYLGGFEDAH